MRERHRRGRGRKQADEASVNLTPLIDVVFVVLILFIIVAPLLNVDDVQLAQPHPDVERDRVAVEREHPVQIHVHNDDSIRLNQRLVNPEVLLDLLREAHQSAPEATPLIFQDKRATFGVYQSVKDAVEAAGFQEMHVVLAPQ